MSKTGNVCNIEKLLGKWPLSVLRRSWKYSCLLVYQGRVGSIPV
jgi:hypothetical protein